MGTTLDRAPRGGDATMDAMPPRRRIPPEQGLHALQVWQADPSGAPEDTVAMAVRYALEELADRAVGRLGGDLGQADRAGLGRGDGVDACKVVEGDDAGRAGRRAG